MRPYYERGPIDPVTAESIRQIEEAQIRWTTCRAENPTLDKASADEMAHVNRMLKLREQWKGKDSNDH